MAMIRTLLLSDDNQHIFSAATDNTVKMWDIETKLCVYQFEEHTNWVNDIKIYNKQNDKYL